MRIASWALIASLTAGAGTAQAVEYRLRVASLHEESFTALLRPAEAREGAAGPGLDDLVARLDARALPAAALVGDRPLRPLPAEAARAWGAVPVLARVTPGGGRSEPWDEVRWDGRPGERTVWVVAAVSRQPQELRRVALRGTGPLRHHLPHAVSLAGGPLRAPALSLAFLRSAETRGRLWDRYLARVVDLGDGVAAVIALNDDPMWPDQVYLVVRQGEAPLAGTAVLGWRVRDLDREAPGWE
jgi:hypothetical protein